MSKFKEKISKYILKKRYIYSLDNVEKVNLKLEGTSLQLLKGSSLLENKQLFEDSKIKHKILKRSKNDNIFCLTCMDEEKKLVGYFWGVVPNDLIWHDSIPIIKGQGFLFNGYVNPKYRGKNVFPFLIYEIVKYMKKEYQISNIIDVVESENVSSVKAHNKVQAKIFSINFLMKFFKRNIFSLYRKKINLLVGNKRNRI